LVDLMVRGLSKAETFYPEVVNPHFVTRRKVRVFPVFPKDEDDAFSVTSLPSPSSAAARTMARRVAISAPPDSRQPALRDTTLRFRRNQAQAGYCLCPMNSTPSISQRRNQMLGALLRHRGIGSSPCFCFLAFSGR
jgi:hypothetical protein